MNSSSISDNPFSSRIPVSAGVKLIDRRNMFGASSFHDSRYIELLNLTLKTELVGLDTCMGFSDKGSARVANLISNHFRSSDKLKKLIVRNSGIPIQSSSLSGKFSKAVIQITSSWPGWIHCQASQNTLQRIELKLDGLYEELLDISPIVDQPVLRQLQEMIDTNKSCYRGLFDE